MNEVFKLRAIAFYNLGIIRNFLLYPVHGVYSGTESVWYSGSKVREQTPS